MSTPDEVHLDLLLLPPEIIQKIISQLDGSTKKTLRLVSKYLSSLTTPFLFSNIVIRYSALRPDTLSTQLEALASSTSPAPNYAQSLEIRGFSPDSVLSRKSRSVSVERGRSRADRSRSRGPLADTHEVNRAIRYFLRRAVSGLKGVREVWWNFGMNDPDWTKEIVMDSLAGLPALEDLTIFLAGGSADILHVERLSGLRRISLHGSSLDFRTVVLPRLRDLLSRSLKLQSLDLSFPDNGTQSGVALCALGDLFDPPQSFHLQNQHLTSTPEVSHDKQDLEARPEGLTHLSLSGWSLRLNPRVMAYLQNLTSLHIFNLASPPRNASFERLMGLGSSLGHSISGPTHTYGSEAIWDALREERIYLREISTDHVNAGLIEYLGSYSGLRELNIVPRPGPTPLPPLFTSLEHLSLRDDHAAQDPTQDIDLAKAFWTIALPSHASSLTHLHVDAPHEGGWCFTDAVAPSLLACTELQTVEVTIQPRDIDRRKGRDVVWTLLNVVHQLKGVERVSIASAEPIPSSTSLTHNPNTHNFGPDASGEDPIKRMYTAHREISKSVTTFGPLDPKGVAKVVVTPAREYVARLDDQASKQSADQGGESTLKKKKVRVVDDPQPDSKDGGLWYRSSMRVGSALEL